MTDESRPEAEGRTDAVRETATEIDAAATAVEVDERLASLASSLLWRIGRAYEDGPVTVRVGLASAAPLFAELPRLRAATDQEVETALAEGEVRVEWVGPRVAGGRS